MDDSTYEDMNGLHVMESIMISPKGIAYLHENSTIAKVKKSVKGLSDIIGNVTPLWALAFAGAFLLPRPGHVVKLSFLYAINSRGS